MSGLTINKKSLKEHLEITVHKEAFEYVKNLVSSKIEICEKITKEIHFLVLAHSSEDRGICKKILFKY